MRNTPLSRIFFLKVTGNQEAPTVEEISKSARNAVQEETPEPKAETNTGVKT